MFLSVLFGDSIGRVDVEGGNQDMIAGRDVKSATMGLVMPVAHTKPSTRCDQSTKSTEGV